MKKKLVSMLLTGVVAVSMLAGCGGSDSSATSASAETAKSGSAATSEASSASETAESSATTSSADASSTSDTAAAGEKGLIAFIPPDMTSPYYQMIIDGAKPTAEKLGYELDVQSPSTSTSYDEQVQILENEINKGVKAIAICTHDASSILNGVQEANEAGIPVIVFNTLQDLPSDDVDVYAYVGYDPWAGGVMAADYVAEKIGNKGDIAILEGLEGYNNTERIEGFQDEIAKKYPDINIVASQPADWERDKGYTVAQNIIQANPDVKAFFAASDEMAIGAAQAMKDGGIDGIVTIGIDGNAATMDSINEGVTTASLDTDPYTIGVTSIEQAVNAIDGKKLDDNKVIVQCFVVDSSNVKDYLQK